MVLGFLIHLGVRVGFFKWTASGIYGGFISSTVNIIFSPVRDREFAETKGKTVQSTSEI